MRYRYHGHFVSESYAAKIGNLPGPSKYLTSESTKASYQGYVTRERAERHEAREAEQLREAERRAEISRKGWETRREREREKERAREAVRRAEAARKGWETRREREREKERAREAERRSEAARKGWETRKERERYEEEIEREVEEELEGEESLEDYSGELGLPPELAGDIIGDFATGDLDYSEARDAMREVAEEEYLMDEELNMVDMEEDEEYPLD